MEHFEEPVVIPAGVSASEVTMVNIQLTLAESTSKQIENVPIVYRNNENNLGASEVDTTTVTVTVTGTSKNIENITASDCVAYIDLKDSEGKILVKVIGVNGLSDEYEISLSEAELDMKDVDLSNVLGKNEKFILAAAYDIHFNKDGVESKERGLITAPGKGKTNRRRTY